MKVVVKIDRMDSIRDSSVALADYIEAHNYKIDVVYQNGHYTISDFLHDIDSDMYLYKNEFIRQKEIDYTLPKELFEI